MIWEVMESDRKFKKDLESFGKLRNVLEKLSKVLIGIGDLANVSHSYVIFCRSFGEALITFEGVGEVLESLDKLLIFRKFLKVSENYAKFLKFYKIWRV